MKLSRIRQFQGQIELITGLHIGAGVLEMHIGGTDNPVIKNPSTGHPYIPGSSLKGKMRSLLEWQHGVLEKTSGQPLGFRHLDGLGPEAHGAGEQILKLFGGVPEGAEKNEHAERIGPSRLAFWDCPVCPEWLAKEKQRRLGEPVLSEVKMENIIDRIEGVGRNPRSTERVPAGTRFDFRLSLRVHDGEDLTGMVYAGLALLQLSSLGGSGSRGYGKLRFTALALDDQDVLARLAAALGQAATA